MRVPAISLSPDSPLRAESEGAVGDPFPARDPFPWQHLVMSLALLAAAGASVALLLALLGLPGGTLPTFFSKNTMLQPTRNALLFSVLLGAAIPAGIGGVSAMWWGRRALLPLRQVADLGAPLALAFMLPSLFAHKLWASQPLPYLLQLSLFGLALERALSRALAAIPAPLYERSGALSSSLTPAQRRAVPLALVVLASLCYGAFFSYYTLLHHRRLGTTAFDLGINVNWCYNALHGQPFRTTVLFGPGGGNMIAGHAIYGMLVLWLPFYAIKPGPEVLLIYQAFIVGLAAIPLYLFATTQVTRGVALVVALAYLMFAPLHGPNFYDFHELPVALFFHFWLYYGIATRRTWLVVMMIITLFSIREDIPVGMSVLGVYLLVSGIRPRFGAVLAVVSAVWFVVDKFVLMPWAGNWWFANLYDELLPAGSTGYRPIVQTMLVNPIFFFGTLLREAKLIYLLHMVAPLVFLPARRASLLFLLSAGFLFTLVTTNYGPTVSISFHYTTHWIPYLFLGTVLMLRTLGKDAAGVVRRRAAIGAMFVTIASHSFIFGAVLQHQNFTGGFSKIEFQITEAEQQRYRDLKKLADMIPRAASVAATEHENPHVAARMDSYTLLGAHGDADYLLINKQGMGSGGVKRNVQAAFSRNSYGLLATGGDLFYLFKKDHVSPETTKAAKAALGI